MTVNQMPGEETAPVQVINTESRVNILQITVVHDLLAHSIALSASFPYICTVDDKPLLALRAELTKKFAELTEPLKDSDGNVRPPLIWGEDGDQPGDSTRPKLLTPDLKSPVKMPTRIR